MSKRDYIKKKNSEKAIWATTYKARIATDGATLGLTAGEITTEQTRAQNIVDGVGEIDAAVTAKESAVGTATTKISDAEKAIRTTVARMKTHPAYSDDLGQDLGIVGNEQTVDIHTAQPELKSSKDPSGWRIDFNLKGYFDGINIYKSKGAGLPFVFLALDTSSPYIDTAEIAIGVCYHALYVLNEKEVGLKSNVVMI